MVHRSISWIPITWCMRYGLCARLKLPADRRVSLQDPEAAAERWTHRRLPWNLYPKGLRAGGKLFRMVAWDWHHRFFNLFTPPTLV
jgi:hypothetical protein